MAHRVIIRNEKVLHILDNPHHLAAYAADVWVEFASRTIKQKGRFTVALSGGKTPFELYALLSRRTDVRFWTSTHIFLVDERYVPRTHQESNYHLLKETLLRHPAIPARNFHHINTEKKDIKESATEYEDGLREFFSLKKNEFPGFDLILLGLGEDGHTASLFPAEEVPGEHTRAVVAVERKGKLSSRVTLTLPVINNASGILFLVTGKHKAPIIKRIMSEPECTLPACLVKPVHGELAFLLDKDAASELSDPGATIYDKPLPWM